MNEYKDAFAQDILDAQAGLVEEFRRDNPRATQIELTAFALGLVKMGSYAIKRNLAGTGI